MIKINFMLYILKPDTDVFHLLSLVLIHTNYHPHNMPNYFQNFYFIYIQTKMTSLLYLLYFWESKIIQLLLLI